MSRATTLNAGSGTFDVATGTTLTQNGVIGGTGGLTKAGGGTLVLGGANTYSGVTTINAGTLALSGGGSIASSSGVDLAAAGTTFDIAGSTGGQTIQDLGGVAGSIHGSPGSLENLAAPCLRGCGRAAARGSFLARRFALLSFADCKRGSHVAERGPAQGRGG